MRGLVTPMTDSTPAPPTPAIASEPAHARRSAASMRLTAVLVVAFWVAFAIFVGLHTYLSMLSHHHSLPRMLACEVLVFLYWAAAAPLIAWLARRYPLLPPTARAVAIHVPAAAALATGFIAWLCAMLVLLQPFEPIDRMRFGRDFFRYFGAHFPLQVLVYAGTVGVIYAIDFHRRSRERALRASELERELARARLDALSAQLQPHFLFNALHTVSGLIRGGEPQAAITTLAGLSDLLRYALDSRGAPEVALRDELDAIRRYVAIQELRHRDRLSVCLDADAETLPVRVPRLLLQPLVENAVRHGLGPSAHPLEVALRARRVNGCLRVEIANSVCATASEPAGFGIGLDNTRERLERLYGKAARLDVARTPDRFELRIDLPWETGGTRTDGATNG